VLRDATSALVYLHTPSAAKPWTALHGDIKASNILLERGGRAVLSDVGIAKQRQLDAAATGRTSTLIKGTPSHLDPEYVRTGERRAETDGYALGMVVLQSLTGLDLRSCGFREAKPLLLDPGSPERWAASLLDPRAGWPMQVAAALAGLVHGLSYERWLEDRMPCEEAERRLEGLAREVGIEAVQVEDAAGRQALDAAGAGAGDAAQPPRAEERSLCFICEEWPHTVRFYPCGHACVCTKCEPKARAHFKDCCPICKSPICSVERGDHVGNAPTYVFRR